MRRYLLPILSGMSLFIVMASVVAATNLSSPEKPTDPFEVYTSLTPGNSSTSLNHFLCSSAIIEDYLPTGWYYCEIHPSEGPIKRVTVAVRDGQIINVIFEISGLTFGHVAQHWGGPDDVRQIQRSYAAFWNAGVYACSKIQGWFTYLSPVQLISLRIAHPPRAQV